MACAAGRATASKAPCGCSGCAATRARGGPKSSQLTTFLSGAPHRGERVGPARVHHDDHVAPILHDFGARGLTVGNQVLIDPRLSPETWRAVLRHELIHVAQAAAAEPRLDRPFTLAPHHAPHEREARSGTTAGLSRIGSNVVSRDPAPPGTTAPAFCPNCHMSTTDIQWETSHRQLQGQALAAQKGTLAGDIDASQQVIMAQRIAMIGELPDDQSAPFGFAIPKELGPQWAAARASVELVNAMVPTGAIPLEVSIPARASFATFFRTLLQATQSKDRYEEIWRIPPKKPDTMAPPCPGSCHTPNAPKPVDFSSLMAPGPPLSPGVLAFINDLDIADTVPQWQKVVTDFNAATATMDKLVLAKLPATSKARQGFEYATDLLERQQKLAAAHPTAVRIPAVFYPQNQFEDAKDESGKVRQVAKGIPWMFYLYRTGETAAGQEPPADSMWVIEDLTSPKGFKKSEPVSAADRDGIKNGKTVDPPRSLFDQLNSAVLFPIGILYWTYPSGTAGQLRTTAPKTLSEWLTGIGMALAVAALLVALTLGTAGAGTVAALTIASSIFGIAGTVVGLQEKREAGTLTEEDVNRAYLTIALDIASALTVGLGRIATVAGETALKTGAAISKIGLLANRLWVPLRAAQIGLEGAQILVVSDDFITQFRAIANSNLPKDQKDKALAKLVGLGVLTLGIQTWGLRGGIKELRAGSPLKVVMEQGRMRLIQEGETPGGKVLGDLEPTAARVKSASELPQGPPRPPGMAAEALDETLPQGKVVIDAQYDADGLVSTSVRYAKGASPHDIKIHVDACKLLEQASGLDGRLKQLIAKIRLAFAASPEKGVHLQIEIWKHKQMLAVRRARLAAGGLNEEQLAEGRADIAKVQAQIESLEKNVGDPKFVAKQMTVQVATEGEAPPGYPHAPEGMYWAPAGDVWVLQPRPGYKGPRFSAEIVDGKPTGKISNRGELDESGVLGQPIDQPGVREKLDRLQYQIDKNKRISRPRAYYDEKGTKYMEPLTTDADGKIRISERESFADVQAKLREGLSTAQGAQLDKLKAGATPDQVVVLVEGIVDTKVRWGQIIGPADQEKLRKILTQLGGLSEDKVNALMDSLLSPKKPTLQFVMGTRSVREPVDYRGIYAEKGPIPEGLEVHHFDPLYLGGGHDLLVGLNPAAHDAVHELFGKLRLPKNSALGDVALDPTSLRNAAKSQAQKAAVIIDTKTGAISYKTLQ